MTSGSDDLGRTVAFISLVTGNLVLIQANRRWSSAGQGVRATNPAFRWMALAALVLLGVAVEVPAVAALFRFEPLPLGWPYKMGVVVALLSSIVAGYGLETVSRRLGRADPSRSSHG